MTPSDRRHGPASGARPGPDFRQLPCAPRPHDVCSVAFHAPGNAMPGHPDMITLVDRLGRDDRRVAHDSSENQGVVAEQAATRRHTSGARHASPLDRKAHERQLQVFFSAQSIGWVFFRVIPWQSLSQC